MTTASGLAPGDGLHPVQESFVEHFGFQCGFCTPGMTVSASVLTEEDLPDLDRLMKGNLCRCTGYRRCASRSRAPCGARGRHTAATTPRTGSATARDRRHAVGQSAHPPARPPGRAGPGALHLRHGRAGRAHPEGADEPACPRAHHSPSTRPRPRRSKASSRSSPTAMPPRAGTPRPATSIRRTTPTTPACSMTSCAIRGQRVAAVVAETATDRRGGVPPHPRRVRRPAGGVRSGARAHPGRPRHPPGPHRPPTVSRTPPAT